MLMHMNRKRKWNIEELKEAVSESTSIRKVIIKLKLIPAGGNYEQIKKYIKENSLDTRHFKGMGWNKGLKFEVQPTRCLESILISDSNFQSFKLKNRLFKAGFKFPKCEECGWAKESSDGRIPIELDHINGNRHDNRLENLRILCPNCHSLKPTHRGLNRIKKCPGGGTGIHATLKMLSRKGCGFDSHSGHKNIIFLEAILQFFAYFFLLDLFLYQ